MLPKPPAPFRGKIDMSRDKSTPDWPQTVKAPAGAPNIVLVLLDDVGFGATSAVGGPVETPELEKLASNGLRYNYNQFHVNAMCSPTRGALLSGRNSHQIGFGPITDDASGYPGYNSVWSKSNASIAEVVKQNGYSTGPSASGTTRRCERSVLSVPSTAGRPAWASSISMASMVAAPASGSRSSIATRRRWRRPATPQQGYDLTADLADDAIRWLHQHDAEVPDKPFFFYFASGGTHVPHHVPKEWIEKYNGNFDQGWDNLRFWAAFLMATHSNGMSAMQLKSELGLGSYKTAWLLAMKLRRPMVAPGRTPCCIDRAWTESGSLHRRRRRCG